MSEPLEAFPHFSVATSEAFEAAVNQIYRGARVASATRSRQFLSKSNRRVISRTSLAYARTLSSVSIQIPEIETYGLLRSWGGSARATGFHLGSGLDISANRAFVASPGQSFSLRYEQFEHLIFGIQPQFLTSKLSALAGISLDRFPVFAPAADLDRPAPARLYRMIARLLDQLDEPCPATGTVALAEFEQAIIVSLLCSIEHDHDHLLERRILTPAFWQVRRAEDFIEANWDKPLTIERLATATEVSVRSLFYAFGKVRGCSPMEFVRRVRLRHARRLLLSPDQDTSITTTAFACGFGNLGHFSGYYRREFGELPSATLKRRRGRIDA